MDVGVKVHRFIPTGPPAASKITQSHFSKAGRSRLELHQVRVLAGGEAEASPEVGLHLVRTGHRGEHGLVDVALQLLALVRRARRASLVVASKELHGGKKKEEEW